MWIDRKNFFRVLVTETAPYDMPFIISNNGFYENIRNVTKFSKNNYDLIDKIILNNKKRYTIPYRYKIVKNDTEFRELSLIHPSNQVSAVKFYE